MTPSAAHATSIAVRNVRRDPRVRDGHHAAPTSVNVVLIGPPGAGKGTQAVRLAKALGVPTISTGDMLRRAVSSGSALGLAVKAVMERGELIADAMMTEIVAARLQEPDVRAGFVLDGFPRTVEQANTLDGLVAERRDLIAIELAVPESAIICRLSQRRVCSQCGRTAEPASSHEAVCPCGGALRQRADDNETTIRERLRTYERATRPLVDFSRQRRSLHAIDGTQTPDLVTAQIARAIEAVFERTES